MIRPPGARQDGSFPKRNRGGSGSRAKRHAVMATSLTEGLVRGGGQHSHGKNYHRSRFARPDRAPGAGQDEPQDTRPIPRGLRRVSGDGARCLRARPAARRLARGHCLWPIGFLGGAEALLSRPLARVYPVIPDRLIPDRQHQIFCVSGLRIAMLVVYPYQQRSGFAGARRCEGARCWRNVSGRISPNGAESGVAEYLMWLSKGYPHVFDPVLPMTYHMTQ